MLTIYPKSDPMESPWSKYLEQNDWDKNIEESDEELDVETAQMSPDDDTSLYQSCPVWDELIFVKCKYCNSSILPNSIKNHVEMRHTGEVKYEKDPEFSIFRKKPALPPAVSLTAPTRASSTSATPLGLYDGPYSRTSPSSGDSFSITSSGDGFHIPYESPMIAEQFQGWPNSPHGATQQTPLNMTNIVRMKPTDGKPKIVIPGGKMKTPAQRKMVPEILPALLSPVEKDEPFNQTFSFSAANANASLFSKPSTSSFDLPSTSFDLPSTSAFDLTSTSTYNMSSTTSEDLVPTYEQPSTSRAMLPYQPISAHRASFEQSFPPFQLPNTIAAVITEPSPKEKEPAIEKLVLRRVLQTDQQESAERSQSVQGLKGVAKNKKDSSQHYFMVVKRKDRPQDLTVARQQSLKDQEKDKGSKLQDLERRKNRTIHKLIQELKKVKLKLDVCNRSKIEYEAQLLNLKNDLEQTKRLTDLQNEVLLKQKAKFEKEIEMLKQANEELSNSIALESAQMYRGIGSHPWNFGDNHMSKQFQTIEEQKLELQRRIEELECECRELKNSSALERGRFDSKLKQYFKCMNELKKRLDEQTIKSEELQLKKDFYEKNLPPEIIYQIRSQLASYQHQSEVLEIYPGLLTPQPTPPIASSPAVSLSESLMADLNYITYQSQMSPDSTEVFPQPQIVEVTEDEEIS